MMMMIANTNWPKHFARINSFNSFKQQPYEVNIISAYPIFQMGEMRLTEVK